LLELAELRFRFLLFGGGCGHGVGFWVHRGDGRRGDQLA
jgi:hypothetical protein